MGDILCCVCGEPWDYYGLSHGDVTPSEKRMILKGRGCPCCKGVGPQGEDKDQLYLNYLESLFNEAE